jgi:hypothetical protein
VSSGLLFSPALTASGLAEETSPTDQTGTFTRVQVPFIPNKGQIKDEEVVYFAKPLNSKIHIDKNGMVIYYYDTPDKKTIVINEIFTKKKIAVAALDPIAEDVAAAFKRRGHITGDIANYYRLSYGTIYKGVDLQLMAFTDKLEKIFTIAPGGDPGSIAVRLKGAEQVTVNDAGALEVITKQGPVNFSPPHAYQFAGEERKPVEVAYMLRRGDTYGFKLGSYDTKKPLFIAPLMPAFLLSAPQQ